MNGDGIRYATEERTHKTVPAVDFERGETECDVNEVTYAARPTSSTTRAGFPGVCDNKRQRRVETRRVIGEGKPVFIISRLRAPLLFPLRRLALPSGRRASLSLCHFSPREKKPFL